MKPTRTIFRIPSLLVSITVCLPAIASPPRSNLTPLKMYPLTSVRLLQSPFTPAVRANREYMLALNCDRLLAPFRREAGLTPKKPSYGNWENIGLDGHTAGHYLSALSDMIAAGADTSDGEFRRRLDYMVNELALCQKANGDGYIGGIPGSRVFWARIASGDVAHTGSKWAPWYNLHKTFAGLRDAYLLTGNIQAKELLVKFGDWAEKITSELSDPQMQQMLAVEQGGMNEVIADIYAITGDRKYLTLARRFCDQNVLSPLERREDRLTGLHANTQIPKVTGLALIANLTGDKDAAIGSRFFWDDVTQLRSVAFGGDSVSEHFNDPKNFEGMLEHREGPETCNTYNMLRLTEQLFESEPKAAYADFYERALFNHLLSAVNPDHPGYVYFTPIRPGHYRVYSQPGLGMWCCVGTGMENPGRYGQFIYAKATNGIYVNLFIASELKDKESLVTLRQETKFPDEEATRMTLQLSKPKSFSLYIRNPVWVADGDFKVKINGKKLSFSSKPSSYLAIKRLWKTGDRVDVSLPMRTTVEGLPDGSEWKAILHGPIVLAAPEGKEQLVGLRAGDGRGDHIPNGPLIPIDKAPVLLTTDKELPSEIVPDPKSGPFRFRIINVGEPSSGGGIPLEPFFRLHDERYQMYWDLTTKDLLESRKAKAAEIEAAKIARDRATIDRVAVGEQQSETDHLLIGDGTESGLFGGRRWRHGRSFQYTLSLKGATQAIVSVTYSGQDAGRNFDVLANGQVIGTEHLRAAYPGRFFEQHYNLPASVVEGAKGGEVVVRFLGHGSLAGGVYDVRLLKPETPILPLSSSN